MSTASEIIRGIVERRKNIADLKKIREEMDPASGVTISIRRGVIGDDENSQNRPWVTIETGELDTARQVIDGMISAAEASLKFRLRLAKAELDALTGFLSKEKL